MIDRIEHRGFLIDECSLPGEGKPAVFPGHINGMPLGQDRFLLLYTTRTYRGIDDNRSVIWQLRADAYDGRVIREGCFAATVDDWDALGDGRRFVRSHLHPVGFGNLRTNVFAAMWQRLARYIDPATGFMLKHKETAPWLDAATSVVQWTQFRLNSTRDGLDILTPASDLARNMLQTFSMPVPLNDNASSWVVCNGIDGDGIAPLRFTFNPLRGLYEWDATGPVYGRGKKLFEASVMHWRDQWFIAARTVPGAPVAWFRTQDLFDPAGVTDPVYALPHTRVPLTAYACPDGVIRLITGDEAGSPHGKARDPLYIWDIDPDNGFAATNRRVVFDSVVAGMHFPTGAVIDQGKLFPHAGGNTLYLAHRIRPGGIYNPARAGIPVTPGEQQLAGIYYATLRIQ